MVGEVIIGYRRYQGNQRKYRNKGNTVDLGIQSNKNIKGNVTKITTVTITALGISVTKPVMLVLATKVVINVCTS